MRRMAALLLAAIILAGCGSAPASKSPATDSSTQTAAEMAASEPEPAPESEPAQTLGPASEPEPEEEALSPEETEVMLEKYRESFDLNFSGTSWHRYLKDMSLTINKDGWFVYADTDIPPDMEGDKIAESLCRGLVTASMSLAEPAIRVEIRANDGLPMMYCTAGIEGGRMTKPVQFVPVN